MRQLIKVIAAGLLAVVVTSSANATTYTGAGVFTLDGVNGSDCNGCNGGGTSQITLSGSNPSTLTANQKTGTVASGSFIIGQLTWVNNVTTSTPQHPGDQDFYADYKFTLSFTSPTATVFSQSFNMHIVQDDNPAGDLIYKLTNATLPDGPFTVGNVTVKNIKFVLDQGSAGSFSENVWSNKEGKTSILDITADFVVTPVPEPTTWAMMILGFAGVGFMAYRRKKVALRIV
jgi:hypothetical protein